MKESELPDDELVRRCLEKDREAWEALVTRYGKLVYALAMRSGLSSDDSADVFQMVFVTAYRNLHLLDRPESLPFWLSTIARREAWQVSRKLSRRVEPRPSDASQPLPEVASPTPLPDEEVERVERVGLVHRGLDLLDERCRSLLQLLFFQEPSMSYEEASRTLGLPLGSIGPTRARCLEKLKRSLAKVGF